MQCPCKTEQLLQGMELQEKEAQKDTNYKKSVQKESINSRLKAIYIMDQKKAFYRQRTPEPSCAKKETADIDLLVISRNGDRKFMQSIRIISRPPSRIRKSNQLSQFR